jgi:hypothetical protein
MDKSKTRGILTRLSRASTLIDDTCTLIV